jgi:transcriptional regulator GlxA family with amidase domain
MRIAVLTFDDFNEIDSFVAINLLNRLADDGWHAFVTGPGASVRTRGGADVAVQKPLEFAAEADAVIFGSGRSTGYVSRDPALLARIRTDPARQLIAGQCSGALVMDALGLLPARVACSDVSTAPALAARGVAVLPQPFHADGNVATAGGCLSAQYIAAWLIARRLGAARAAAILRTAAPVGEEDDYAARALAAMGRFVPDTADLPAA